MQGSKLQDRKGLWLCSGLTKQSLGCGLSAPNLLPALCCGRLGWTLITALQCTSTWPAAPWEAPPVGPGGRLLAGQRRGWLHSAGFLFLSGAQQHGSYTLAARSRGFIPITVFPTSQHQPHRTPPSGLPVQPLSLEVGPSPTGPSSELRDTCLACPPLWGSGP